MAARQNKAGDYGQSERLVHNHNIAYKLEKITHKNKDITLDLRTAFT